MLTLVKHPTKPAIFGGTMSLVHIMKDAGLTISISEGRRLIEQGGVRVNEVRVKDIRATINVVLEGALIQVGKRRVKSVGFKLRPE